MRKVLYWYLPLGAAIIAACVFAYGFVSFLRGDTGRPVDILASAQAAPSAPQTTIAPIILGDSLARGAGDAQGLGIGGRLDAELQQRRIAARRTVNVAVSGARTPDLLRLLDRPNVQQLIRESNVVIVSIGGNDLWGGNDWRNAAPPDPDQAMNLVLGRIETAIEKIRSFNPRARICFIGLYNPFVSTPGGAQLTTLVNRWNARLLEHFGDDPDFTLVQTSDLFAHHDRLALDRFHPNGEAYGLMAKRIAESM